MEWHWCFWGEWHGPFTLKRIDDLTATLPNQFLMAGGGTDKELDELRTFTRLGGLAILSPHVTPAAVSTLRSFPELRELILCGPAITDEFLSTLPALTRLESITLVHTACTAEGVRKFLDLVPRCKVYRASADSILPASLRRELQMFLPET
jgi:uracil phosphoribosyltransferase